MSIIELMFVGLVAGPVIGRLIELWENYNV
jgi:hypothetical protein